MILQILYEFAPFLILALCQLFCTFFGRTDLAVKVEKQKQKELNKLQKKHNKRALKYAQEENKINEIKKEISK